MSIDGLGAVGGEYDSSRGEVGYSMGALLYTEAFGDADRFLAGATAGKSASDIMNSECFIALKSCMKLYVSILSEKGGPILDKVKDYATQLNSLNSRSSTGAFTALAQALQKSLGAGQLGSLALLSSEDIKKGLPSFFIDPQTGESSLAEKIRAGQPVPVGTLEAIRAIAPNNANVIAMQTCISLYNPLEPQEKRDDWATEVATDIAQFLRDV